MGGEVEVLLVQLGEPRLERGDARLEALRIELAFLEHRQRRRRAAPDGTFAPYPAGIPATYRAATGHGAVTRSRQGALPAHSQSARN